MRHPGIRQGDLFEPCQRPTRIRSQDRAILLALLQTLLKEALAIAPLEGGDRDPGEVCDDQDHV
jgi:hypothetical protein